MGFIDDFVQGDDFLLQRTYPLDGIYTIAFARITVKRFINAPDPVGTFVPTDEYPVYIEITGTPGAFGQITDQGTSSQKCTLFFVLPNAMTRHIDCEEMYFYGVTLFTSDNLRYSPESGAVVSNRPSSTSEVP